MPQRALISIKAANIDDARVIAQGPPFNVSAETAAVLFVPANEERTPDGSTITTPATIFWASGEFSDEHFSAMSTQAAGLDWASVDAYDLLEDPGFPLRRLVELEAMSTFSVRTL